MPICVDVTTHLLISTYTLPAHWQQIHSNHSFWNSLGQRLTDKIGGSLNDCHEGSKLSFQYLMMISQKITISQGWKWDRISSSVLLHNLQHYCGSKVTWLQQDLYRPTVVSVETDATLNSSPKLCACKSRWIIFLIVNVIFGFITLEFDL